MCYKLLREKTMLCVIHQKYHTKSMKENWSIDLINHYIKNKVEENLHLDYKAAGSLEKNDKKANKLSKDASAFAISDGGTIIYGIKEDSINKHLPEKIDSINRSEISKEWIQNF